MMEVQVPWCEIGFACAALVVKIPLGVTRDTSERGGTPGQMHRQRWCWKLFDWQTRICILSCVSHELA